MKTLIVAAAMFVSPIAFASEHTCTELKAAYETDSIVEVGRPISLTQATKEEVKALDSLTKQQLIAAAKVMANRWAPKVFLTSWAAASYLREASEAEEVYVGDFSLGEETYTKVQHFPGGNEVSVIFKGGTKTIIAFINDSDFECK